ncbi:MAG: putative RNA-binding protein with TRAM domain [Halobacteriales archaeon]|jgi:predicted RNA-binding protein with TRAM domain
MPDCPLADDCPSFSERIEGMGCQHYGDRGGKEWCQHYNQPIEDLKTQPVKAGEQLVVDVTDMHESGAGVARTEDGFILLVNGVVPEARSKVEVTEVHSNHARARELERLPAVEDEEEDDSGEEGPDGDDSRAAEADAGPEGDDEDDRQRLGSRDNFWGGS